MSQDDIDAMLAGFDSPAAPPPVARAPEPEPEPEPEPPAPANDILDLTESMAAAAEPLPPPPPPASAPTNFRTIDGHSDVVFSEPRSRPEAPERPLLSSTTSAAVDSAFNALAQTVLVQNARTLEDLVKEMLRPMLKSWLDDNLPSLVERIVKAEIERVSRGRNGG